MTDLVWRPEPGPADYQAAADFLALFYVESSVDSLRLRLERAALTAFLPGEILRAARLDPPRLPPQQAERPLSPVLLVRNSVALMIAAGLPAVHAAYFFEPGAKIPAKIV